MATSDAPVHRLVKNTMEFVFLVQCSRHCCFVTDEMSHSFYRRSGRHQARRRRSAWLFSGGDSLLFFANPVKRHVEWRVCLTI